PITLTLSSDTSTLSLHDALPISDGKALAQRAEQRRHQAGAHIGARHLEADQRLGARRAKAGGGGVDDAGVDGRAAQPHQHKARLDRKSTRLNSSHVSISYAVFCF